MTPNTTRYIPMFIIGLIVFILFDHAMRVDQQNLCGKLPDIDCPTGLWIWPNI